MLLYNLVMEFLDYIDEFNKHTFKPQNDGTNEITYKFKIKDIFKDN